ncbi:MAG: SGNH/GDSL hydrolase family protein [Planctomycetota bacterium]|jgi:hypothetical protein
MKRREFLKTLSLAVPAAAAFHIAGAGGVTSSPKNKQARKYLRSIMPSREKVDDFIQGRCPKGYRPGEILTYDYELGWVQAEAIGSMGVDGSKVFYSYEGDGARKVVNFPDKPSRIHTYGDSFTHCSQASNGETWAEYLAAHLQEPIRNYGVGGYSVYQAYRRMLKVEKQNSAEYIILNIWDDDHFRNLDSWRSIRFGQGSRCGFTLPHLRVDIKQDRCEQFENLLGRPEEVYKLCDEDFVWKTFQDDPILQLILAARANDKISSELINPVAVSFGIGDEIIADTDATRQIKKIHTEAALYATKNIVTWIEKFVEKTGKKLMVILSFGRGNIAAELQGKPRFDQSFVNWLKHKPYPVIDMRDAFSNDYKRYKAGADSYLEPYYNGHHSPAGNFFTAWAIKDRLVEWLDPPPLPYRK